MKHLYKWSTFLMYLFECPGNEDCFNYDVTSTEAFCFTADQLIVLNISGLLTQSIILVFFWSNCFLPDLIVLVASLSQKTITILFYNSVNFDLKQFWFPMIKQKRRRVTMHWWMFDAFHEQLFKMSNLFLWKMASRKYNRDIIYWSCRIKGNTSEKNLPRNVLISFEQKRNLVEKIKALSWPIFKIK